MKPFQLVAVALAFVLILPAVTYQPHYNVIYSGGSLMGVNAGQVLRLYIDPDAIRLIRDHVNQKHNTEELNLKVAAITEVSYGQEVHRRVGTAVAVGILSLGIGALVALSKSKKHYIGVIWADGDKKGGMVLQADKNEFRGILAALEGLTGKKAVNTDPPTK